MKRATLILLLITGVLIAELAAHSAPAKVMLRSECEVASGQLVKIRDVATVQAGKQRAGKIEEITVANGPLPGAQRMLDASYIRAALSAAGMGDTKVIGPSRISLTGKCIRLSSQELAEEAKSFVMGELPRGNRTYDVIVERSPREIVLPDTGKTEIRAHSLGSSVRTGPNTIAINVAQDGKVTATTSALLQVKAVADVLVATAPISQGEAISAKNTTWEQRDVTRQPQAIAMAEGGALQDWVARRTIQTGSLLTSSDVTLPPAVRQGDTVTLVVKCGSVTIRTTAQAKDAGRAGDTIRVLAAASQGDVRARIVEPGVVEINR